MPYNAITVLTYVTMLSWAHFVFYFKYYSQLCNRK